MVDVDVHPAVLWGGGAAAVLIAAVLIWRITRSRPVEDTLTIAVACIATAVSAQGMWRFFGDVLGFDGPLRVLLFAFLELAVAASAIRARRSMRENYSAGIDGVAVWVFAALTAVLASMDARSLAEAAFRLAAPLVAAWLWERGMAIERRRITGKPRIHWRITPERVLVRLGLAEATDRTAAEVDTQRRLTRVALAAKRARDLREAGAPAWRQRRALRRLQRAVTAAGEHTGLARDPALQQRLCAEVAALYSAAQLLDVAPAAAWSTASATAPQPVEQPVGDRLDDRSATASTTASDDRSETTEQPVGQPVERPVANRSRNRFNNRSRKRSASTPTRERARLILAERPDITGSQLGRDLGVSASRGRALLREIRREATAAEVIPMRAAQ